MTVMLPRERTGFAAPPALAALRQGMARAVLAGNWRTEPSARETTEGGVRCLRFAPAGSPRATLVHFHGGGFRQGMPEMAGPFAVALAERCGVAVVCPRYRLAPEHPFPAGLIDGMMVIRALRKESAQPVILSGDSAGGGLAASLTALSVAQGDAPAALLLLSAWLDLTVASPCYEANRASDPLFSREAASEAAEAYLQGWPAKDPLASPLLARLAGFPPTFISVGAGEVLADDASRLHAALYAAGGASELSIVPGMEHTAVVRGSDLAGAAETLDAVKAFLDRLLARLSSGQPRRA